MRLQLQWLAIIPALLLAAVGGPAFAADYTLRLASFANDDDTFGKAETRFKEEVEKLTDGKVEVTIYNNSTLGSNREALELAKSGSVDFVIAGAAHATRFAPELDALMLPYIWSDRTTMFDALDGEVGQMLVESVAKQGLHILGWWDTGFRGITNSVRPVVNPGDVEGLKLRTLPSAVQVAFFEKIGAIPTAMDWVEVMPSLQQNVIDGLEAAPSIVYPYRVYEAQSYYSLTHHSYEPVLLIMSVASENKLPPELAEAVAQAAATASTYQREINDAYNRDIMGELGKVIEINEVPEATIDSFREAAKSVYPVAFDSVGPVGKKAIETIQAMQ